MSIKKVTDGYFVDIQPGGRAGQRIRKTFIYLKDAEAFKKKTIADWQRGEFLTNGKKHAMPFPQFVDLYTQRYVLVRMKHPERSELYRLAEFKNMFESKTLGEVSHEDGENYIAKSLKHGAAKSTINRNMVSLKRIFSWAVENGYLPMNPLQRIKRLKEDGNRVRWLTNAEIKHLMQVCEENDPTLAPVIVFGLNTGFRKSNIESYDPDKDRDANFITALKTKSGNPYDVPINTTLRDLARTVRTFDTRNIGERFRDISRAAGFWKGTRHPDNVTLHTLRHTFCAHALQNGVPIYTVSKWMGHSSVKITEAIYGHLSKTHHQDEIRKFPGLGGGLSV